MRCPRCQFENIPGQERCFKCSSVLESTGSGLEIHPPRMASHERPWRRMGRWGRECFSRGGKGASAHAEESRGAAQSVPVGGLILSVVPGLGHVATGRFRSIRILWLVWLILFLLTVVLYATQWGWVFLGIAAACHAYMALRVDLLDYLDELGARLIAILLATAVVLVAYIALPLALLSLQFTRIPFDIPAYNVRSGDLLVFRPFDGSTEDLSAGTIVYSDAAEIRMVEGRRLRMDPWRHRSVGQVVGRAYETVALPPKEPAQFYLQGNPLDPNRVPVPRWLQAVDWRGSVPADHYFVSQVFRMRGRGMVTTQAMIVGACMVPAERVHRRAVMVWWPLHRRHFLP